MTGSLTRRDFLGAAALAAAAPAFGKAAGGAARQAAASDRAVSVEKDVVFGKGGTIDLRCDLYRPAGGPSKRAALVCIHGGGFGGGSKETLTERVRPYASLGYLAVVSQYRLTGQAGWPSMLEDVRTAIGWTRRNAGALGVDPERIVVVGYSAGGYLALAAAGTQVAACVAYYPATIGPPPAPAVATYVSGTLPPTVLFHGTADTTVPIESSEQLSRDLRAAGVPSELHTVAGAPHVFDRDAELAVACAGIADLFLYRNVL